MEDLQCKQCQQTYDEEVHVPKILPKSEFTICKVCLNNNFNKESLTGKCPFTDQYFK
jgi:hypothetical protein